MCGAQLLRSMPREGALDVCVGVVNRHVLVLTMRTCRHCVARSGSAVSAEGSARAAVLLCVEDFLDEYKHKAKVAAAIEKKKSKLAAAKERAKGIKLVYDRFVAEKVPVPLARLPPSVHLPCPSWALGGQPAHGLCGPRVRCADQDPHDGPADDVALRER